MAASNSNGPGYVILGATGGIGSVLCRRLAQKGARLVVAARHGDRVRQVADEVGGFPLVLDARRPAEVQATLEQAAEHLGRVDGVANLVGSLLLKSAHLTTDEEWQDTVATNLTSSFAVVRAGARLMMENGGGSIVLMSSAAARMGLAHHEAIAAAKAGVIGLALPAASSYGPRAVRVNCVAPGLVQTGLTRRLTGPEQARKKSEEMHPLGRLGTPEDIASAIDWLLSPEQKWVTGQVLGVDGGLATVLPRPAG